MMNSNVGQFWLSMNDILRADSLIYVLVREYQERNSEK